VGKTNTGINFKYKNKELFLGIGGRSRIYKDENGKGVKIEILNPEFSLMELKDSDIK
jgi:hypothetical protein